MCRFPFKLNVCAVSWPEAPCGCNLTNVLDSGHRRGEGNTAWAEGTETGSDGTKYCEYLCPLKFDSAECGVSLAALCLESPVQWFLTVFCGAF